jgi:hypothetical protein
VKLDRAEFLATLLVAGLAVVGCDSKPKKPKRSSEDESDEDEEREKKKKKKKKADGSAAPAASENKPAETAKHDEPAPPPQPTGGGPDLASLLGTNADGFAPLVFAKLKEGMSPAEAAKLFPGGDVVDEYGFAEIKSGVPAGVALFELSYQESKLTFASIVFTKAISDDAFWAKLVAHLQKKLLPVEMKELEPGKKSVMWIGPGFHSITLGPKISFDDAFGYELKYAVM